MDEFIADNERVKSIKSDWVWEVLHVNCRKVAQGWRCPNCGALCSEKRCKCTPKEFPISPGMAKRCTS